MGHEYVELKPTEAAIEAYRQAATSIRTIIERHGLGQTTNSSNVLLRVVLLSKSLRLRRRRANVVCARRMLRMSREVRRSGKMLRTRDREQGHGGHRTHSTRSSSAARS